MSEHTKEPWVCFIQGGESASVPPATGFLVGPRIQSYNKSQGFHPDDARRIVACVNACAGYATEELENGGIDELYKRHREAARAASLEHIDKLTKQRDEALAALESVLADNQAGYERHGLGEDTIDRVRSTISRLKS